MGLFFNSKVKTKMPVPFCLKRWFVYHVGTLPLTSGVYSIISKASIWTVGVAQWLSTCSPLSGPWVDLHHWGKKLKMVTA